MPKPISNNRKYRKYKSLEDILLDTKVMSNGCMEWQKYKGPEGYGQVRFEGRIRNVHRIVTQLVYGLPTQNNLYSLHSCDNPPCVNPDHLRWGTPAENKQDAIDRNRANTASGMRVHSAKLTDEDVKLIRFMHKTKIMSVKNMTLIFPVNQSNIWHIITRKTWKHL